MSVAYHPGTAPLVVRPGLALLTPDLGTARRAWELLTTGAGPDELLRDLVRDGFAGMPPFVLVDAAGAGVRVLARGEARAEVETADGTTRWTGDAVSTWAERSFDRVTAVRVRIEEAAGESLPLHEGIVRCGGFEFRPGGAPTADEPGPADEPGRADEPGPADEPGIAPPLIDVVPAAPIPDEPDVRAEAPRDPAQTRTDDPDDGFEHLFESTIVRSVEDAAVREVPADEVPADEVPTDEVAADEVPTDEVAADEPAAEAPDDEQIDEPRTRPGDHDGYTITSADLDELRERTPDTDPLPAPEPPAAPEDGRARLELSTGDVITLDRDVVIGRRPQVDRVQGDQVPTVVTVPSPQQDVSRTHLRIGRTGGAITATDLHSMNGTVLIGADGGTRALDGGTPQTLSDGDTLDIGDGVTLTLRLSR